MTQIIKFSKNHIRQARELVLANYNEERAIVTALPQFDTIPDEAFKEFTDNGLGVTMLDGSRMLGFLCCDNPWDDAFGSVAKGTFVPDYGHGAIAENRGMIYKRLYQAAAEIWVNKGITYHSISLYAHDARAIDAFFTYGFGMRCIDAVRSMTNFNHTICKDIVFDELAKADIAKIRNMRKSLAAYLGESPSFMRWSDDFIKSWLSRTETRDSKVFAANLDAEPIAFMEVMEDGESFASAHDNMRNICGAFCLPQHRGKGVMQGLLNHVITQLRADGFDSIGVDFESFNPLANSFWLKYFTAYSYNVERKLMYMR